MAASVETSRHLLNRAAGVTGNAALGLDNGLAFQSGTGSPESVVTGPIGSVYLRTDGGAGATLYVKTSGSGATGGKEELNLHFKAR